MRYVIIIDGQPYETNRVDMAELLICSDWLLIDTFANRYANETENGKPLWFAIPEITRA